MKKKILLLALIFLGLTGIGQALAQCVQTAPWSEDFENSGTIPNCWTQGATNGKDWEFDNTGSGHIGSNGTINGTTNSNGYFAWLDDSSPHVMGTSLLSPMIDVSGLTNPMIEFYRLSDNEGSINVDFSVDVWDGATWNTGVYFSNSNSLNEAWEYISVSLSSLTITGDIQIRFVVDENNGTDFDDDVAIDDVGVIETPACPKPWGLFTSNITGNSVDLAWINGGSETAWNIEYGPAGFAQGTGTSVAAGSNPFTLTGLSGTTSYDIYVQADCGADQSVWTGPINVITLIAPINCTSGSNTALYSTDFENGFPSDWSNIATGDPQWEYNTGTSPTGTTGPDGAFSGNGYLLFEAGFSAGGPDTINAPSVDLSTALNVARMTFYYHMYGADMGELIVEVSNDGGSSWTNVFSQNGAVQTTNNDPWTPVTIDLTPYIGSVLDYRIIGIRGAGSASDIAIDVFQIETCVSCPAPFNLTASNVTGSSVDLAWTNGGTETSWNVEYGPVGFTPGTGTMITATSNPYTLTGLSETTNYDIYVRAECSVGDESFWTGPVNIYTLIAPISCASGSNTNLFYSDFEGSLPTEWTKTATSNPQWEYNTGTTGSTNTGPDGAFSGTGYIFLETSGGSAGDADTIKAPSVDLSTALNEAQMSFYYHMYGADMAELKVDVSTDGGASWTNVFTQAGQVQTIETDYWTPVDIDLSTYIGQTLDYRIIGVRGGGYEGDMAIDLFAIETCVSCPAPTNFSASNVTSTSVDLAWTNGGSETMWNIEWGAPGFTPGIGSEIGLLTGTTNNPETVSSLSSNTNYDIYVQANCGTGDESFWTGPVSIFTPQVPVSTFPWDEDFEAGGTEWTLKNGTETNQWFVGSAVSNGGTNSLYVTNDGGTTHAYDNGSTSYAHAYRDVVLPSTPVEAALSFDFLGDAETSYDNLRVFLVPMSYTPTGGTEISTTGSAPSGRINLSGNLSEITSFQYQSFTLPSAYLGQSFRIVFQWKNDGFGGQNPPAAVDNVNISLYNCLAPSGLVSSDITTDQATVAWDDNTAGANTYIVEYGPTGFAPGTGTTVTVSDTFAILTGLAQDQGYEYYVSAECGDGTFSQNSDAGTFQTLVACDPVTGLSLVDVTTTTVELTWSAPAGYNAFIIEYGPAGFTPGSGTTIAAPPATVTGLNDNTEYDFYVYSDCGGGTISQPEGPINVMTPAICPAPSNVVISEVGADSLVIAWTSNGSETNWVIEYDTTGFTLGTGTQVLTTTNPDTLLGLNPEWTYDFYVWADCGGDLSDTIGPETVTMQPTCLAPSNLVLSEVGADSVVVEWTVNGTETNWVIEYDTAGFTPGSGTQVATTFNPDTLLGLNPEWTYDVYVWADCGAGDVSDTITGSFTTQPSCLPVSNITISNIGTDNVDVSWTAGGTETQWNIEYGPTGFTPGTGTVENNITNNPYNVTGLNQNTDYDIYVTANCGGGDLADTTGPESFTTDPTCPPISNIQLEALFANSASVSWTAGGSETQWILEYGLNGFTVGTGNTLVTNNNPETITGLTENTDYEVYVRGICSPGDTAALSGPFSFTTPCNEYNAPFSENFDGADWVTGTGFSNTGSQIASCWTSDPNATGFFWGTRTGGTGSSGTGPDTDVSGNGKYVFTEGSNGSSGASAFFTSPLINLSTVTDPQLVFSYHMHGNDVDSLRVEISNDGGISWNSLLSIIGEQQTDETDPWAETSAALTSYANDIVMIRFMNIKSGFSTDIAIDEFTILPCVVNAGQDGATEVCRLDTLVDLNSVITTTVTDGEWSFPTDQGLLENDTLLNIASLPADDYEAYYITKGGCGNDTAVAIISVFNTPNAGQNGTLSVCLNEPIDLFSGLNGSVELGGTWYDPTNNPLSNSQPSAGNQPGIFNFEYVVGNNVCPADTAVVVVEVDGTCDWLSLGQEKLTDISVYPNPATSVINIVNPSNSESLRVEMLDMNGRIVVSEANALENASEATIAIDHLEKGMYTLRIYNEDGQRTFKIVKQ